VDFLIHTLPVIGNLHRMDGLVRNFKMKKGLAAETSGGLMLVIKEEKASQFVEIMKEEYGQESWLIGEVVPGKRNTVITEDVEFLEVW